MKEKSYKFSDEERINWLRLIRSENVGPRTFYQLLGVYGSAEKSLLAAEDMSIKGGRRKPIKIGTREGAEVELEKCDKIGARLIAKCEDSYPKKLSYISDPPPVITVVGDEETLNHDSIAIVGARNASANGYRMAGKLASDIAEEDYIVVSGLARGIDTAAHTGAVSKGKTVAVIAGGIDVIYPKENENLYKEITEKGAIIAEPPLGTQPRAENFPQRNRIISGLSLGVVVVEASARSGSLITARFAVEQDREVMAVPGFPMDPRAEGPNKLIKNGAALVENAAGVIDTIKHAGQRKITGFFEEEEIFMPEQRPSEDELKDLRSIILSNLSTSLVEIDDLVNLTGAGTGAVLSVLLELELAGRLNRHPGNKVSLLVSVSAA